MENRKLLQVRVTKTAIKKLNGIKEETGATSMGEVIRDAVSTYAALITLKRSGGKILIEKNDTTKELILPK